MVTMVTRYYGSVLQTTIALRPWAVSSFTASNNGRTVEIRSTTPIVASNVAGAAQTGTPAFTGTQDYHRYVAASHCFFVYCCTHRLVARHSTTHEHLYGGLERAVAIVFDQLCCRIINVLFMFANFISRTLPHHGNVLEYFTTPSHFLSGVVLLLPSTLSHLPFLQNEPVVAAWFRLPLCSGAFHPPVTCARTLQLR
jgi:hypothetical protein